MISSQKLGITITSICLVMIILLFLLGMQYQSKQKEMCENTCAADGNHNMTSCPYHQQDNTLLVLGIVSILTAFVGGIGAYLIFKTNERLLEEKEYDLTALNDEEKNIFLFVKEHPEGIYQSELVTQFNLSKVRMTRILDTLERRELIERKRRGMTNLIVVR